VRDAFEERSLPDDVYGLAPRTLADLGDDAAAPMMLAWGVGKATVLRAEAAKRTVPGEMAGGHPQRAVENLSISRQGAERQRDDLGTMGRRARSAFDRLRRATRRGRA
jgi:hypothetical protein